MGNMMKFMEVNVMLEAIVEMRRYYKEFESVAKAEPSPFVNESQIYEAKQLVEGGFYDFMERVHKLVNNG